MNEFWDILDENGNQTGKRIKRESFNRLAAGEYHLVVHIWIINSQNEFLIQQRSENRLPMPGEWAATGGSALSGESSKDAAIRELFEELGISVKSNEILFLKRLVRKNSISDIWKVGVDADLSLLDLQKEEVKNVKWVSPEALRQMIGAGLFHNYGQDYFDVIFPAAEKTMQKDSGAPLTGCDSM